MGKKFFLLLAVMLALCANITAQTTALIAKDHGVEGAMHRMGCHNDLWLGPVMMKSGILESQLNRLPVGTQITVPPECASSSPALQDRRITQAVLAGQLSNESAREQQSVINGLRADIQVKEQKISDLENLIANLQIRLADQIKNPTIKKIFVPDEAQELLLRRWRRIAYGELVVLLALLVVIAKFALALRSKKLVRSLQVSQPAPSVSSSRMYSPDLVFHGTTGHFWDTTQHTVGCNHCSETNIRNTEEDKTNHLRSVHPNLRLHETTPERVRTLLGRTA